MRWRDRRQAPTAGLTRGRRRDEPPARACEISSGRHAVLANIARAGAVRRADARGTQLAPHRAPAPSHHWRDDMANRNQDYYSGSRRSQQENWRDEDDDRGYYGSGRERNEADAGTRGGSYDQGRVQYGRREQNQQNEQSGSQGRYAGYGDFGSGDYGGGRSGWTGQDRYGQTGYGAGDYGQGSGQTYAARGVFGQNDYRAGGYGDRTDNDRERSNYGADRQNRGGYGGQGGMGYSGGSGGQGYSGGGYGYGGS